jgi:hypothetical protein
MEEWKLLKELIGLLSLDEPKTDEEKTEKVNATIPKDVPEKKLDVRLNPSEYLAWYQEVKTALSRSRDLMILPIALRTKLVGSAASIAREAIKEQDDGPELKKGLLRGVYGECWEIRVTQEWDEARQGQREDPRVLRVKLTNIAEVLGKSETSVKKKWAKKVTDDTRDALKVPYPGMKLFRGEYPWDDAMEIASERFNMRTRYHSDNDNRYYDNNRYKLRPGGLVELV